MLTDFFEEMSLIIEIPCILAVESCLTMKFYFNILNFQVYCAITGMEMLKCGKTDIYIKPECVCSFYNVNAATLYHGYSSCPAGAESDIVTQLKCRYRDIQRFKMLKGSVTQIVYAFLYGFFFSFEGPDCKKYSLNNNGPCINGGKLTCKGQEVAPNITCECPPNYSGAFCENKVENVHISIYVIFLLSIFKSGVRKLY